MIGANRRPAACRAGIRQPKRIASCMSRSGTVSVSGSGRTEASKSRMSDRDTGVLPTAVRLKQALERPQKCSQYPAAHVDGVLGKRKAGAELALDLGLGPSRDLRAAAVCPRTSAIIQ